MADRYRAFLSYAHRYKEWVGLLRQNLEACLQHCGAAPYEAFVDLADLGSGRSWVAQLQEGVGSAEHLVLVVTPESLASSRVEDEWGSFIATRNNWARGHVHLVRLVDSPLPPFLAQMQWVDFAEHDEVKYREGLRRLLAGLLGQSPRDLPALPPGLSIPQSPVDVLPARLRSELLGWLDPRMRKRSLQGSIANAVGISDFAFEGHSSTLCAASALIVAGTGADDRVAAGLRIVTGLLKAFEDDDPQGVEPLRLLQTQLKRLRESAPHAGLLGDYLRQVATDHELLVPYFQQKAEFDLLDRVYVKLELRREWAKGSVRGVKEQSLAQPCGIRQVLALSPTDTPWATGRWVILGDPGAGKTTLVRHLASELAREAGRTWVPVFESLPRMLSEREWLFDRIARRLRRAGYAADGLPAVLEREANEGRLLLLLDGLDEVPSDDREEVESILRAISTRWPRTPIVVTSRQIGYRKPGGEFRELELLSLDESGRREFLARWFGRQTGLADEERAAEALAVLREDSNLWDVSGNPLYLTLLALLLEQGTPPQRNRARLYDQIFELLLGGKHKATPHPIEHPQLARNVLRLLSYKMTEESCDSEGRDAIETRLYQRGADLLRESLERVPRWRQSMRLLLDDIAERTGILGPHDGPGSDWRFWHRTFREALAAEELEGQWKRGGAEAILNHAKQIAGAESLWAEPYALLTGRIQQPDQLVTALVRESPALGLRALATAQGLQEATIIEVLDLATERADERGQVFLRLPELIGDGARAWRLIDRLRRQTRNGADLFFLDLAAREAMHRYPEQRREIESLLTRFFDHIPEPPQALLRYVDTPLDGRVEWWRAVPSGTFWMGSPDGEGRFTEHPRDRQYLDGFQLSATVVTNAQYALFDPAKSPWQWESVGAEELQNHPRVGVTWYEAVAFCDWLSASFEWARGARLPSEAEWECACRAGTSTTFWSGDQEADLARVGWYEGNSALRTHLVGEKPANPFGFYDLHGQVAEWILDPEQTYPIQPAAGTSPSSYESSKGNRRERIASNFGLRGGCLWDPPDQCRSAWRYFRHPGDGLEVDGFRVLIPSLTESGNSES